MPGDTTRYYLQSQGYQIRYRIAEWVECLIAGEGGAWVGRHLDREGAFEAAIHLMFPSPLARRLLEEHAQRAQETPKNGDETARPQPLEARGPVIPLSMPPPPMSPPLPPGGLAPMSPLADSAPPAPSTASTAPIMVSVEADMLRSPSQEVRARTLPPLNGAAMNIEPPFMPDPRTSGDPERSVEALDVLTDRIRDSREELGLCSPERQRLAMLAWICEARSHADAFPEDLRIRDRVGAISRQLTDVGKTFWPGSVTALQLNMQPRDLPRHLLNGTASSWYRAAELAEAALRAKEQEDERRGFDSYGWADAKPLGARPADPAALLDEICGEVERLSGRLSLHAAPSDAGVRPDAVQFSRWVRALRWLRCTEVDPERWARLAGRLRWWAFRREPALGGPARELESTYAPQQSWGSLLGLDPEVRRIQLRVLELLSKPPKIDGRSALLAWFQESLPLGDTYHGNLVKLMEPHRELVLKIAPEELPDADRRLRRRLARLQEDLQNIPASLRALGLPSDARDVVVSAEVLAELGKPRPPDKLPSELVARVRSATSGKRSVLVSTRRDPEMQAMLSEAFGFASLELRIAEPRRAQALGEAIEEGQYDLVLAATGFQLQGLDHLLSRACRAAGVPYLRVNRGTPLATLRALMRGLDGRV